MEGLFVVVRNTTDFHIEPRWYFTSPELERYLPIAVGRKWDQGSIGPKLEAFAIAGCDTISTSHSFFLSFFFLTLTSNASHADLLRTARQKAAFLKTEIRDLVGSGLGE
jgi:hypothetical protein